jgi:hypothetical protein
MYARAQMTGISAVVYSSSRGWRCVYREMLVLAVIEQTGRRRRVWQSGSVPRDATNSPLVVARLARSGFDCGVQPRV